MAKELATLTATTSVLKVTPETMFHELEQHEMHLTSFFGGKERGRCLQFTLTDGTFTHDSHRDHVQMTRSQVEELVVELTKWLAE